MPSVNDAIADDFATTGTIYARRREEA